MSRRLSQVCVLVSGGVDSSILVADLLRRGRVVHPLYVRCGLIWEKAELRSLRRVLAALKSPRLKPLTVSELPVGPLISRHWSVTGRGVPGRRSAWDSVYLPGRNLLLAGQAGLFCSARGIPVIALGLLKGNPFPDARPAFLRRTQALLSRAFGVSLRLTVPYSRLTKRQVAGRLPGFPLEMTFSCLRPRGLRHCRACSKCEERFRRRER
jgi:7-cyano-7-deazaguanine synthase